MASPPRRRKREPVRGEFPDVRYLVRADDYEIALIVPPPSSRARPPAEPLVRLRFQSAQVEVVLTPAELGTFSADLQQLQEYLQREGTRRPHRRR
jgi:hypothetical protein